VKFKFVVFSVFHPLVNLKKMRRKKTQLVAPGSGTLESPLSIIQPKIKILLKSGKDLAVRDFNGLSIFFLNF
jgi:hypothetical protein